MVHGCGGPIMVSPVRHTFRPLVGRNFIYPDVQISQARSPRGLLMVSRPCPSCPAASFNALLSANPEPRHDVLVVCKMTAGDRGWRKERYPSHAGGHPHMTAPGASRIGSHRMSGGHPGRSLSCFARRFEFGFDL